MALRRMLVLVMLLAPVAAAGTPAPPADEGPPVNAVVALVNGEPVTKMEVDARVTEFLIANPGVPPEEMRSVWERAREFVVEHRLLIQEARRRNVQVEPEAVNDQIKRYQDAGINTEGRRDLIREQLMVRRMLRRLLTARSISPQEVADYYAEHRDEFALPERRHVYLIALHARRFREGGKAAAKAKALGILQRLKRGEDFAALAKAHSHGAYADQGGDQGWIKKGSLRDPLDEAVSKLGPGEVSGPIETADGYVLLKVAAVQLASRQPLAKARATILARLQAEHHRKRREQLIARLQSSASILRLNLYPKKR